MINKEIVEKFFTTERVKFMMEPLGPTDELDILYSALDSGKRVQTYAGLVANFEDGKIKQIYVGLPPLQKYVTTDDERLALERANEPKEEKVRRAEKWINALDSLDNGTGTVFVCGRYTDKEPVEKGAYRWPAGGLLTTLADESAVMLFRDEGATSYKNHLTISSGLGLTSDEIHDPRYVMLREGLEELLFHDDEGFFVPAFQGEWSLAYDTKSGIIERNLSQRYRKVCGKEGSPKSIDAQMHFPERVEIIIFEPVKISDGTVIFNREDIREIKANAINIDPPTVGIDVLSAIKYDLDADYVKKKKVRIADGEGFGRDIYITDSRELAQFCMEGGSYHSLIIHGNGSMEEREVSHPLTPVSITTLSLTQGSGKITQVEQMRRELERWAKANIH